MRFLQRVKGTHRDYQVMFGLQLVTQREDKALRVLLALTNQEHAATQTRTETIRISVSHGNTLVNVYIV